MAGNVLGSVDFGLGPLTAQGNAESVFVAKYDCTGLPKWAKVFGMPVSEPDATVALAIDGQGASIVTGVFYDGIDFGCGALPGDAGGTGFIVKLDASGACVWSKRFGGPNNAGGGNTNAGQGVAVDAAGNVVVAGYFDGATNFGGGLVTSMGGLSDLFVVALDPAGNFRWFKDFGSYSFPFVMTHDSSGELFLSGPYQQSGLDFGGGRLPAATIFLAKLDASGGYLWAESLGAQNGGTGPRGIAADSSGNIYLGGSYMGNVTFGGSAFPTSPMNGNDDAAFTAGFMPSGSLAFSQGNGGTATSWVSATALLPTGDPVFTGVFQGTLNLGGPQLVNGGGRSAFLLRLDGAGGFVSSRQFGDGTASQKAIANGLAATPTAMAVIGGTYSGPIDFGGGPLPTAGGGFVAQVTP